MSLRDQLLAKGLVSEKRAKQIDRELKSERKSEQGQRDRLAAAAAEAAAKAKADAEAAIEARLAARREAEAARAAHELRYRVRQIVTANRLAARGPVPFHHRTIDGPRIGRLQVSEDVARELRAGRLAIAGYHLDNGTVEHVVVAKRAADKLAEIAPAALVFHVTDSSHFSDPSEAFLRRDWEPSLRPHRVSR